MPQLLEELSSSAFICRTGDQTSSTKYSKYHSRWLVVQVYFCFPHPLMYPMSTYAVDNIYEVFQWIKFFPEYFFHFPHPLMNPSTVTALYNTHLSSFMVVWQESLNPNAKIVSVSFQNPFILDNKI